MSETVVVKDTTAINVAVTDSGTSVVVTELQPTQIVETVEEVTVNVQQVQTSIIVAQSEIAQVILGQAGPPGAPGIDGDSTYTAIAAGAVSAHRAVLLNALGQVIYADNQTAAHASAVLGISTNAALAGGNVVVQTVGELIEPSWNWTLNQPVFIGATGVLTQTPPAAPAVFSRIVGFPTATTKLFVSLRDPI